MARPVADGLWEDKEASFRGDSSGSLQCPAGDMKHLQDSFTGKRDGRAALHMHDGHFFAPSQPADQFTQGGWSVGSAGALLGRRARGTSSREASHSSELAVLKQSDAAPFSSSALQNSGVAAAHGMSSVNQPDAAGRHEQAMTGAAARGLNSRGFPGVQSSRHSSRTSSRRGHGSLPGTEGSSSGHSRPGSLLGAEGSFSGHRGPGSLPGPEGSHSGHRGPGSLPGAEGSYAGRSGPGSLRGAEGSYSEHSSAQFSPRPLSGRADGRADSSQQSGSGPGLSRMQSSSGLQSRHSTPGPLGPAASRDDSSMSYPGSAGRPHSQHRVDSDSGLQVTQHPLEGHWEPSEASAVDEHSFALGSQQQPLHGHWGTNEVFQVDEHNFALERSYGSSSSSRSELSQHDEDNIPFAGEDSHVLSEWGQGPDRSYYNHQSDLLPQQFPYVHQLGSPQSNSMYSGDAAASARSLPGDSQMSSASRQPHQQPHQIAGVQQGSLHGQQSVQFPRAVNGGANIPGLLGAPDGQRDEGSSLEQSGGARGLQLGAGRLAITGPLHGRLEHFDGDLAESRAAGLSTQLPDFSDSGGWYEAEHTDDE